MRISDWSSTCALPIFMIEIGTKASENLMKAFERPAAPGLEAATEALARHLAKRDRAYGKRAERLALSMADAELPDTELTRSEERRVGKEGVSTCRSLGSPYH